jgi:hypothetical protein
MLSPNLFIKTIPRFSLGDDFSTRESVMKRRQVTDMRYRPDREKLMMKHQAMMKEQADKAINNTGVSKVPGHTRFGFQTILDHEVKPLPTAPPIVGGNVDWTKLRTSPATQFLHNFLATKRPMSPAPALGSGLKLGEPSRDSIHTNI